MKIFWNGDDVNSPGLSHQPIRGFFQFTYTTFVEPIVDTDDCIVSVTSGMNGTVGVISGMVDPIAVVVSNSVGVISGMTALGVGVVSPLADKAVGVISGMNDSVGVESGFCDNVETP